MFGIKRKSTIREDRTFRNTQKENTATITDFISGCEEMSKEQEFDGIENDEFENNEYEADEMSIEA